MPDTRVVQGRELRVEDIGLIQGLLAEHRDWGRTRLSEELCRRWDWRNARGRIKDMSARALLLKLKRAGHIRLPKRRRKSTNGFRNRNLPLVAHPTAPICDVLRDLRPLAVTLVAPDSEDLGLFNCQLFRYHYLGHRNPVGENIRYLVRNRAGQPVSGLFRDAIRLCSHGHGGILLDPAKCKDWAQQIKSAPEGFTSSKIEIDPLLGVPAARYTATIDTDQVRRLARGFQNPRNAVGDAVDIAVHCHNELDPLSAIQEAKQGTRIPLLVGEKLKLVQGFNCFSTLRRPISSIPVSLLLVDLLAPARLPTMPSLRERPWHCATCAAWCSVWPQLTLGRRFSISTVPKARWAGPHDTWSKCRRRNRRR